MPNRQYWNRRVIGLLRKVKVVFWVRLIMPDAGNKKVSNHSLGKRYPLKILHDRWEKNKSEIFFHEFSSVNAENIYDR
jgi:hypothetical protein